jgi:hypothetical protein
LANSWNIEYNSKIIALVKAYELGGSINIKWETIWKNKDLIYSYILK